MLLRWYVSRSHGDAARYIYLNGHNLRAPRIYVESAFRNAEWQALRALCIAAAKGEQL
jgi:hypothetical protein